MLSAYATNTGAHEPPRPRSEVGVVILPKTAAGTTEALEFPAPDRFAGVPLPQLSRYDGRVARHIGHLPDAAEHSNDDDNR